MNKITPDLLDLKKKTNKTNLGEYCNLSLQSKSKGIQWWEEHQWLKGFKVYRRWHWTILGCVCMCWVTGRGADECSCPLQGLLQPLPELSPALGLSVIPSHQALPCSLCWWFTAAQCSVWNQYLTSANIHAQMAGPRDIVRDCILIM